MFTVWLHEKMQTIGFECDVTRPCRTCRWYITCYLYEASKGRGYVVKLIKWYSL